MCSGGLDSRFRGKDGGAGKTGWEMRGSLDSRGKDGLGDCAGAWIPASAGKTGGAGVGRRISRFRSFPDKSGASGPRFRTGGVARG